MDMLKYALDAIEGEIPLAGRALRILTRNPTLARTLALEATAIGGDLAEVFAYVAETLPDQMGKERESDAFITQRFREAITQRNDTILPSEDRE